MKRIAVLPMHPEIQDPVTDLSFGFLNFTAFKSGETPPRIETVEAGGEIEFTARHPSLQAVDVSIVLCGDVLTIRGEKKTTSGSECEEPGFGAFSRSFDLPAGTRSSKIHAALDGGILAVQFPRPIDALAGNREIREAA